MDKKDPSLQTTPSDKGGLLSHAHTQAYYILSFLSLFPTIAVYNTLLLVMMDPRTKKKRGPAFCFLLCFDFPF